MDEFQKYKVKGLSEYSPGSLGVEEVLTSLSSAGYYQCEIDEKNSYILIPIVYANNIDDIEEILLGIDIEFVDE